MNDEEKIGMMMIVAQTWYHLHHGMGTSIGSLIILLL
jgi:hypothetical protein